MNPSIVPTDVYHTVTEAEPDQRPRRSVLGDIDSVALLARNEPRPPPPVVVGGRELIDGAVPTKYGPAVISDPDGWSIEGPEESEPLPFGCRGLSVRFIAPSRPAAAALDTLHSGSQLTESIRQALAEAEPVQRYRAIRRAAAAAGDELAQAEAAASEAKAAYDALFKADQPGLIGRLQKAAQKSRAAAERVSHARAVAEDLEGRLTSAQAEAREVRDRLAGQLAGAVATQLEADLVALRRELLAAARPVLDRILLTAEALNSLARGGGRARAQGMLDSDSSGP
jgi:hypothetical protein